MEVTKGIIYETKTEAEALYIAKGIRTATGIGDLIQVVRTYTPDLYHITAHPDVCAIGLRPELQRMADKIHGGDGYQPVMKKLEVTPAGGLRLVNGWMSPVQFKAFIHYKAAELRDLQSPHRRKSSQLAALSEVERNIHSIYKGLGEESAKALHIIQTIRKDIEAHGT